LYSHEENYVVVVFFIGCSNKPERPLFLLGDNTNNILADNIVCYDILLDKYGIDLKKYPRFGSLEKYVKISNELSEGEKYNRFIFVELQHSGDVVSINPVVLLYGTKGVRVINLKPIAPREYEEKMLTRFDADKMYRKLEAAIRGKAPSFYKLLIIDFEQKDTCQCTFYNNLDRDVLQKIKSLEFFK